ncbi:mitochondrial proton/calcium exchanger protein-like protein isoform X1 [Tanacetum coccineum]
MGESAKRHEENSNMIKEIRASTDAAIRNQGASIKTLEIQIRLMSKVLQKRGFGSLTSSTEINPRDHVKSISTTVEADTNSIRHIGSSQYAVSTSQNSTLIPSHIDNSIPRKEKDPGIFTLPCYINNACFKNALANLGASVSVMPLSTYLNLGLGELAHTKLTVEFADRTMKYPKGIAENVLVGIGKFVFHVEFIILDMPKDIKVPLILERPFLSTAHAKIDIFKRKITLRVGDEKIIFKSVKPASCLIKRVYMLSLRERMKLDLEARLMGLTLVLNGSMEPLYEDYIELNDLNVPLELRRDQVDDLMPTIEEGEVIEEVKARNDARIVSEIFGYPSDYDQIVEDKDPYIGEGREKCLTSDSVDTPLREMNKLMKIKGRKQVDDFTFPCMIRSSCIESNLPDPSSCSLLMCSGTINMGLWYSKDTDMSIIAYSDVDHVGCQDTIHSTSGSAQFLGDKLVTWSSKKQKSTTILITEAEYIALSGCCAHTMRCIHSEQIML